MCKIFGNIAVLLQRTIEFRSDNGNESFVFSSAVLINLLKSLRVLCVHFLCGLCGKNAMQRHLHKKILHSQPSVAFVSLFPKEKVTRLHFPTAGKAKSTNRQMDCRAVRERPPCCFREPLFVSSVGQFAQLPPRPLCACLPKPLRRRQVFLGGLW